MTNKEIIGKKLIEIYETAPSITEGFLDTNAHYFSIVLELEGSIFVELGLFELKDWNSKEQLIPSTGTAWATQNKLEYKNQIIKSIVERDPEEYYEGALTLILENDVIIEQQGGNGNQLFIDTVGNMRE